MKYELGSKAETHAHSWYAVITSDILFDKDLAASEKLLMALISCLEKREGYCYASNKYLGDCMNLSVRHIQTMIGNLETRGYLRRDVTRDDQGEVQERRLVITSPLLLNPTPPPAESSMTPPAEDSMYNNILFNNKENISFVDEKSSTLPTETPLKGEQEEEPSPVAPPPSLYKAVQNSFLDPARKEDRAHNFGLIKAFLDANPEYPHPEPYVDLWNMFAVKHALSQVQALNEVRKKKIKKRSSEKQFDFVKILTAITKATFLLEKWNVTFDWLIENDSNYLKVLEGQYK